MGLLSEGINEVIGTTENNAAPMGVICRGGRYTMVLFKGSHTAENILRDGWFVANLVYDPIMYVETAFGDLADDAFVTETVNDIGMQRLKNTEAWVAFRAEVNGEGAEAFSVTLTLLKEEVLIHAVHPVNRGFNAIIEAAVHTTRYLMNHDPELEWLIRHHLALARKCGREREREAAGMIERVIHSRNHPTDRLRLCKI